MKVYQQAIILLIAQLFGFATASTIIFSGGLIGQKIAPTAALATLPVFFMVLGVVSAVFYSPKLMQHFGRKIPFIAASASACLISLLAYYAINEGHFYLFCLSTYLLGNNQGFVQQYRFASIESVPKENAAIALSITLVGGLLGGVIGVQVASSMKYFSAQADFSGGFFGAFILNLIALITLFFYKEKQKEIKEKSTQKINKTNLIRNKKFLFAAFTSLASYVTMSIIMTATPLSMDHLDFTTEQIAFVIQSHVFGMYFPFFFTGFILKKIKINNFLLLGVLFNIVCIFVAYMDHSYISHWIALVLLGVGWSFLFFGGTYLVGILFQDQEKFAAQSLNDTITFGGQALATFSAGFVFNLLGWGMLLMITAPLLLIMSLLLFYSYKNKKFLL